MRDSAENVRIAWPLSLWKNARHHRQLQQRAGRHRYAAVLGKLPLIEREEAAGGGDAVDAGIDQLVGGRLEGVEHVRPFGARNAVGGGIAHHAVLHRKRPGARVADVAD